MAPLSPDNVARLVLGVRRLIKTTWHTTDFVLRTIISCEPMVGLTDQELLLDLWRHPLPDNRYGDVVQHIQVFGQPTLTITMQVLLCS